MELLHGLTIEELDQKTVAVILRTSTPRRDMLLCQTFLEDGKLFIDCIPRLNRKYVVQVPDDSIISKAAEPTAPAGYLVVIEPESNAGQKIQSLMSALHEKNLLN
jgi:hypothetical protein